MTFRKPNLKPLSQRPEPTSPEYPSHWYDDDGNIITIPFYKLRSDSTLFRLREVLEEYGISESEIKNRQIKAYYIKRLQKEYFVRMEAKKALDEYRARLEKWRTANSYNAA